MKKCFLIQFMAVIIVFLTSFTVNAQEDIKQEIKALKERVKELEDKLKEENLKTSKIEEGQKSFKDELSSIIEALKGIEIGLSATIVGHGSIGNDNNKNIPSDRERKDRVDGSISADLEISKKIGDHGLATLILSGANGEGIDPRIPSWWGINGDAEGDKDVYLKELWYEHKLLDDKLVFTLGKVDLTAYFDSNAVANDETTQFLSPGFVHSVAIEFPDENGPGVRLQFIPMELLDISFAWAEGDADWDELGKRSFFIGEVGLHPKFGELKGNYRLYSWFRKHQRDDEYGVSWKYRIKGKSKSKDGWGLGLSIDQAVNPNVTLFGRLGYQDKKLYEFDWAWSLGAEIKGDYWGRNDDVLGAAFGMAMISADYKDFKRIVDAEPWFKKDESHLELYYRFQLNKHIAISPNLQILWNAQGNDKFDSVTVIGLRGTIEF
ncbi:MAG: carbohydrate porin [Thermodesulfobacteriota bacterium]